MIFEMKNFLTLVLYPQNSLYHADLHMLQICSLLFLAACTWSAPGTPNRSPGPRSLALEETQGGISSPADNEKRAITVGPTFVPSPVRYIAIFYDWSGYFRILMPTLITSDLLNLFPFGVQPQSIPLSVLSQFVGDPVMSRLPLWQMIGATATYANTLEGGLEQLQGAVVNLAIDFNIMPVVRYHNPYVRVATQEMEPILVNSIRDFLAPYWLGSPSSHLVALDPRQVNMDWCRVPDARSVADLTTYVFSFLTPVPGSPSKSIDRT